MTDDDSKHLLIIENKEGILTVSSEVVEDDTKTNILDSTR